jgi:2-keto-4-pentenoate hydratase/2-oxohepta-3-ene-1,7-dioic acid hydratase in catechol pathway
MAARLVQFQTVDKGERRIGVELGNGGNVVDITKIDASIPNDMRTFIESWDVNLAAALRAVKQAESQGNAILAPSQFTFRAPIYNPEKLICIGMNYIDHCTEQNLPVPEEPVIFNKFASAITEPNGPVTLPSQTTP